ncbi:Phospholipase abhd3 [Perkinsus olseni]|uniref:Phospholipase abhd3 n=1 Tax=Perkinsus olseni TaxID=32597 RepID=A0A7J6S5M2_PEROL|nr:Phospholipase abhd3 [Perkinsus olseni]
MTASSQSTSAALRSSEGRTRPNLSVEKFWAAVCAEAHPDPHDVVQPSSPPPKCRRPRPWWALLSFLRLSIESCRWLIIPILGLAPLLLRPFTIQALLACLGAASYLAVTADRYRPNGRAKPGIEGRTESTEFGKLLVDLLESRAKAFKPTPYILNGHLATAIPFLVYRYTKTPGLRRRWMYTHEEGRPSQSVALDWCLPGQGNVKGVVIILAGINGGPKEGYVLDMIQNATSQGYAACCLIARGSCHTQVVGGQENGPCGSRVTDVEQVIDICHAVTDGNIPVSMIGYSLGGIIATNSVARLGSKLKGKLNCCVSISGAIRSYENCDFPSAIELWQPIVAYELKRTFLGDSVQRSGFKPADPNWYDNTRTILDVDREIFAPSQGYETVLDYYHHVSAISPVGNNKGKDIAIPTLCVHAYDDPLIHVDSAALLPVDTSRYLFTFVTPCGGHVGWPQGWAPWKYGYAWVSDTALSFMNLVAYDLWRNVCGFTSQMPPVVGEVCERTSPADRLYVLDSMVRLFIEASREYFPFLVILAVLYYRQSGYGVLLLSVLAAWGAYLFATRGRFMPNGKTTPGIRGGNPNDTTGFVSLVKKTLKERYDANQITPYILNGHWATALLWLVMDYKKPQLERRWFKTDDESPDVPQSIALDWCIPKGEVKGIYLALHGLNGGSGEGYVVDLYNTAVPQGYAVCTMISRGLSHTPCVGGPDDAFSGARVTDAHKAIDICHKAAPDLPLMLVGYSMGGIVAANTVAKYGPELKGKLTSCVVISGGTRLFENYNYPSARQLWHPMMAEELKESVIGPMVKRTGFQPKDSDWYNIPMGVVELDAEISAPAHGFASLDDYYHQCSATSEKTSEGGKNIAIPTLCVHAYDDPVIHVDSSALLPSTASRYIFSLVTPNGGHVGWPQGWAPWKNGFNWITDTTMAFSSLVADNQPLLAKY